MQNPKSVQDVIDNLVKDDSRLVYQSYDFVETAAEDERYFWSSSGPITVCLSIEFYSREDFNSRKLAGRPLFKYSINRSAGGENGKGIVETQRCFAKLLGNACSFVESCQENEMRMAEVVLAKLEEHEINKKRQRAQEQEVYDNDTSFSKKDADILVNQMRRLAKNGEHVSITLRHRGKQSSVTFKCYRVDSTVRVFNQWHERVSMDRVKNLIVNKMAEVVEMDSKAA
jgi:hypothetical protein